MDRLHLLPMELPRAHSINGKGKRRMTFIRSLALGCVLLAAWSLLYVMADYHSAQSPLLVIVETSSTAGASRSSNSLASVEAETQYLGTTLEAEVSGWSYDTSRNLSSYIHPEKNTAILSPIEICAPIPYLLIVICSAVANINSRMSIRNTWANTSYRGEANEYMVSVAFLLGQSDNETLNNSIVVENLRYNDIIQEKFYDTYNNLTLKSSMMLKWVTKNCQRVKYLMKTDDDMFVNVPKLLRTLRARTQIRGTLIGILNQNSRPILDPKSKWYTPKYMFSESIYPNYLAGTGYVMSIDVVEKLYNVSLSTPILHIEDVYITGICARIAKLHPAHCPGFNYVPRKLETCILRSAITVHRVNTSVMHTIWNKLHDGNVTICANL